MFTALFISKTVNNVYSSNVIYMNYVNWSKKKIEYPAFKNNRCSVTRCLKRVFVMK